MIARAHSGPQPHSPASVQLPEEVPDMACNALDPGTVAVPNTLLPEASSRPSLHKPFDPLEPLELPGSAVQLVLRCQSGGPRGLEEYR
jgi:hypothetical protein